MPIDSSNMFRRSSGERFRTAPAAGGERKIVAVKAPKVGPTPVTIVSEKSKPSLPGPTRLGTPAAFLMLAGLALAYFALHGWDKKYGAFGGSFAGLGGIPTVTPVVPVVPVAAVTAVTGKIA